MTNAYSSQLKGWAIDRAINIHKNNGCPMGAEEIISIADALVAYCYNPVEEIEVLEQELAARHEAKDREDAFNLVPATGYTDKTEAA